MCIRDSIYNALGSKVTVMVRSKVLRLMDGEISKRMNVFLRRKGVTPVSYTHLDVYKRQQPTFLWRTALWLFGRDGEAP